MDKKTLLAISKCRLFFISEAHDVMLIWDDTMGLNIYNCKGQEVDYITLDRAKWQNALDWVIKKYNIAFEDYNYTVRP